MAIERSTNSIGLSILEKGTPGWGVLTNQNMDLIDAAFGLDRDRITSLENETAALPLALAGKVGHNLLQNNVFSRAVLSDPALPVGWTIISSTDSNASTSTNGAVGYATRDTSTYLIGKGGSQAAASLRLSITNVNLAQQTRPFPGVQPVLDPASNIAIATNDPRQLTNGFIAAMQPVILSANTKYTLSSYGKAEIPTSVPPINVHWKIGVVFKSGNTVLHSHFSSPQTNYTSDTGTKSFERAELSFTTPNLPVVQAEIWLVSCGNSPGSIGSCYFDGVQLEQSSRATALETFSMRNGDFAIDGDLIVGGSLRLQQDQLVLATNKVVFSGNVQIGDDITEDILDVFTKISTFYGPVKILGDTIIGDSPIDDDLDVTVNKTTFFNNGDSLAPQGGHVEVQGDLVVKGNTVLGDSNADTVTINASLVTAINDITIGGDVEIDGSLTVARAVTLGTNQPADKLTINMSGLGVEITGDVKLNDDLIIDHSVEFGTPGTCSIPSSDTFTAHAGIATFDGSMVIGRGLQVGGGSAPCNGGPITLFTDGGDFDLTTNDVSVVGPTGTTFWDTQTFTMTGSLVAGQAGSGHFFHTFADNVILGDGSSGSALTADIDNTTFTGNVHALGDLLIDGDANIQGDSFLFGTGLIPSRTFVSYQPTVSPDTLNLNSTYPGQPLLGGTISFGDGYDTRLTAGRRKYLTNVNFYANKTTFGGPGTGPGDENVGDVDIGGNLAVFGSTTLGNDIDQDQVHITAYELLINTAGSGDGYGNATIKIGGGYQNVTWTGPEFMQHYLSGNRGGMTLDNNGNLWMDGKLTVNGPIDPIEIIVTPLSDASQTNALTVSLAGGNTFVVEKTGNVAAKGTLSLNDGYTAFLSPSVMTFARSAAPMNDFTVWANEATFSNHITATSITTTGSTDIEDLVVHNDATIEGNATVQEDFTVLGDNITLGSGLPSGTLQAPLDEFIFGIDGDSRGNVLVANDLTVRHNVTLGSFDDIANLVFDRINISVDSERLVNVDPHGPNTIEQKGLRVGGGYQNNVFNSAQLDHGGVTIDAYGNVFADGSLYVNGDFGFNALTLTAHLGTPLCDFLLQAENKTLNDIVFTLDNLGNVEADGYYFIHDKNIGDTCDQPISQTYPNTAAAMVRVINDTLVDVVYEVDNAGNVVADGYLTTHVPSGSNLATASVTVGTGEATLGDFNLTGHQNASVDPIGAAIAYMSTLARPGKIFVKKGTYQVPAIGWAIPVGVEIEGECPAATIVDGTTFSAALAFACQQDTAVRNLTITSCTAGVSVTSDNIKVDNVTILDVLSGIAVQAGTERCSITNNKIVGDTGATVGLSIAGQNHQVDNNTVLLHDTGLSITGAFVRVSNNTFSADGTLGMDIVGNNCLITGNRIEEYFEGLNVQGDSNIVESNYVLGQVTSGTAFIVSGDSTTISNNKVKDFGDNGVAATNVDALMVRGNHFWCEAIGQDLDTAILLTNCTNSTIESNEITQANQAFAISGSLNKILNNNFTGLNAPAITGGIVGGISQIVSGNRLSGYAGDVLEVNGTQCHILSNELRGGATAISVSAPFNIISCNNIKEHTSVGINLSFTPTSGCIATSNHIVGAKPTSGNTGINIAGNENSVTANYVTDHILNGITVAGTDNIVTSNVTLRN